MRPWVFWIGLGICVSGLVAAICVFGAKESLFPGLLILVSGCLVLVTSKFNKWTKKSEERREDPYLMPGVVYIRKLGEKTKLGFMVSNPGGTTGVALNEVHVLSEELDTQGKLTWKWESVHPVMAQPTKPGSTRQISGILPVVIFTNGLVKLWTNDIPWEEAKFDSLIESEMVKIELVHKRGEWPARKRTHTLLIQKGEMELPWRKS